MSNLLDLFNYNANQCYRKMNMTSIETKRTLSGELLGVAWDDFEVAVQLVQEYTFSVISKMDEAMFPDQLRHYLYNSKLQKNIATFSLCSPDSLRYLAHEVYGHSYAKIPDHCTLTWAQIDHVGVATDFSIGKRLGVDLDYSSDDFMIDDMYAIKESLKSLIPDCNPARLQYSMSYCGRFVRLIRLFGDHFSTMYFHTKSVTAYLLSVASYWIQKFICFELNEINGQMQSIARSPVLGYGIRFEEVVKNEINKFKKSHNLETPSADDIKAEILNWIK